MKQELIFIPVFLMVALTFLVWCWMYVVRINEIHKNHIPLQDLATRASGGTALGKTAPADNLQNLFELPVLFYALAIVIFLTNLLTPSLYKLALAFVALRALHSIIHCSFNHVMTRFTVYQASSWVLWVMWAITIFSIWPRITA